MYHLELTPKSYELTIHMGFLSTKVKNVSSMVSIPKIIILHTFYISMANSKKIPDSLGSYGGSKRGGQS
jgi:hypothetical protein